MTTIKTQPLCFLLLTVLSFGITHSAQRQQQLLPTYSQRFNILSQKLRAAQSPKKEGTRDSAMKAKAAVRDMLDRLTPAVLRDAILRSATNIRDSKKTSMVYVGKESHLGQNTSKRCAAHINALIVGLYTGQSWAIDMLDATGKPKPDIKGGNLNWPGGYKECLDVRGNTEVTYLPDFSGQYCTASAYLPASLTGDGRATAMGYMPEVLLGLCVPDTCSDLDLFSLISDVFSVLNVTGMTPGPVTCSHKENELDARAVIAIVICGIFLLLVALGTTLDIVYIQIPKWEAEAQDTQYVTINGYSSVESEIQPLLPQRRDPFAEVGLCIKLLVSFSVYTNGSKLLSTDQPAGSLTCVHGIRFLSITWVVFGHVCIWPLGMSENMLPYLRDIVQRWTFQIVFNAPFAVDSFFVLSGLLVAYLSLKEMKRRSGKINWLLFYIHRFWRLTPVYMIVIMIHVCLLPYWVDGPFQQLLSSDSCEKNWWTNLLYINNLVNTDNMCCDYTWYLANDMQFYILSPLIFVPFFFYPVAGVLVSVFFLLVTSVTPALLTIRDHVPPSFLALQLQGNETMDFQKYLENYYIRPYNRMGPYVVGMLAGYFLYCSDCKLKIQRMTNLTLWAIATSCALAIVYGLYNATSGQPLTLSVCAFYNALSRQVWGACVAWVVVACVTGNGGFVNTILSWRGLVPLSRLTYCIYLLHIIILDIYALNQQALFYVNDVNLVTFFLGTLVVSYMAAFVVSLVFEAPMMMLEKVLLHGRAGSREHGR